MYFVSNTIFKVDSNPYVIYFGLFLIFLLWFRQAIFVYRIRNNYFGNSEYEIREFLAYIVKEASKSDLDGGSGPRKLIDPEEFMEQEEIQVPQIEPKTA